MFKWIDIHIFVVFWYSVMTQMVSEQVFLPLGQINIYSSTCQTYFWNYIVLLLCLGVWAAEDIKFYLIMCIHTYCTFHPKPRHVSTIIKGRNISLSRRSPRQKCLLNSMSHFLSILKSLLWPYISLTSFLFYFYCGCICSSHRWSQLLLLFWMLLNAVRFLGPVTITCVPQLPFHQKDIGNLKCHAEFL